MKYNGKYFNMMIKFSLYDYETYIIIGIKLKSE